MTACRRAFDVDVTALLRRFDDPALADFRAHRATCPDCDAEVRAWIELDGALRLTAGGDDPTADDAHPAPAQLLAWNDARDQLDERERAAITAHLARCVACTEELAALASAESILARAGTTAEPLRGGVRPALGSRAPSATRSDRVERSSGHRGGRVRRLLLHPAFAYGLVALLLFPALRAGLPWRSDGERDAKAPTSLTPAPLSDVEESAPRARELAKAQRAEPAPAGGAQAPPAVSVPAQRREAPAAAPSVGAPPPYALEHPKIAKRDAAPDTRSARASRDDSAPEERKLLDVPLSIAREPADAERRAEASNGARLADRAQAPGAAEKVRAERRAATSETQRSTDLSAAAPAEPEARGAGAGAGVDEARDADAASAWTAVTLDAKRPVTVARRGQSGGIAAHLPGDARGEREVRVVAPDGRKEITQRLGDAESVVTLPEAWLVPGEYRVLVKPLRGAGEGAAEYRIDVR